MGKKMPKIGDWDPTEFRYECCCGEMHSRSGSLLVGYILCLIGTLVPPYLYLVAFGDIVFFIWTPICILLGISGVLVLIGVYGELPLFIIPGVCMAVAWFACTILAAFVFAVWIIIGHRNAAITILSFFGIHPDDPSQRIVAPTSSTTLAPNATEELYHVTRPPPPGDSPLAFQMFAWRVVLACALSSVVAIPPFFGLTTFRTYLYDKAEATVNERIRVRRAQSAADRIKTRIDIVPY